MLDVERSLQKHLDRWLYLFGLSQWKVTWELLDRPIASDVPVALNDYCIRRTGRKEAHIKFDRFYLKSDVQVEGAVIHELLHLYDHGIGNDAHKLIERLEIPLRRVRRRASR